MTCGADGKWRYDTERCWEGIYAYIDAWFRNEVFDEVLTARAADEREAARVKIEQLEARKQRRGVWKVG